MELVGCHCCGQVARVPAGGRGACPRCGQALETLDPGRRQRCAALAAAGLILYPAAITLPVMHISQMGHHIASGVLSGGLELIGHGDWFVGGVVIVASVLLPLAKLGALLWLCTGATRLPAASKRHLWRAVEISGRWGMLDVLVVAVLVASVKLGDLVTMRAGPGAAAFCLLVIISLLASAAFDARSLWTPPRTAKG